MTIFESISTIETILLFRERFEKLFIKRARNVYINLEFRFYAPRRLRILRRFVFFFFVVPF